MFEGTGEDAGGCSWLPKGRGAEGDARNTRRMARQARREVRQKVVRRSYTHRDSLSFVRPFLVFLFFLRSSYSFFLFYPCPAVASFDVPPRGMCYTLYTRCGIIRPGIHIYILQIVSYAIPIAFGCFFDCELISRLPTEKP